MARTNNEEQLREQLLTHLRLEGYQGFLHIEKGTVVSGPDYVDVDAEPLGLFRVHDDGTITRLER